MNDPKALIELVLKESKAEETEVIYQETENALTRFSNNVITQNVSGTLASVSIRTVKNGKTARVETNKLDKEGLKEAIKQALKATEISKADPELQKMESLHKYKTIKSYCEKTANMTPLERAEAVEKAAKASSKVGFNAAGIFSSGKVKIILANSKGLFLEQATSQADFDLTVVTENSEGWAQNTSFTIDNICIDEVVNTAIEKAEKSRFPQAHPPGKYTVIMEHAAVADLLLFMNWIGFSTKAIQEKRSYFANKLNKKIFGNNITIIDDAFNKDAPGIPFDFEGIPREQVRLIEKGVFKNMLYDRRTAKKDGKKSTGHGLPEPNLQGPFALNLCIEPGNSSVKEMIASTDKGILVTHLHYTNILNPADLTLTGMTRDGTFLIEKGKIKHPVRNYRFTESLINVFNNVELLSKDRKYVSGFFFGGALVPALKVKGFNFSSATEF
ncbi:MAG: TldD/PmbA family protein [Candidatus Coatesbacteria bacterium]|nr:TldD/PmbA family protein [Candidatus Coatesbacteria bacterium]